MLKDYFIDILHVEFENVFFYLSLPVWNRCFCIQSEIHCKRTRFFFHSRKNAHFSRTLTINNSPRVDCLHKSNNKLIKPVSSYPIVYLSFILICLYSNTNGISLAYFQQNATWKQTKVETPRLHFDLYKWVSFWSDLNLHWKTHHNRIESRIESKISKFLRNTCEAYKQFTFCVWHTKHLFQSKSQDDFSPCAFKATCGTGTKK